MRVVRDVLVGGVVGIAAAVTPATAQVLGSDGHDPVSVRTAWSRDAARPGETVALAVVFELEREWHINPSAEQIPAALDFLIPTGMAASLRPQGAGASIGQAQFPSPRVITVNYTGQPTSLPVYADEAIVYLPVTIAADLGPGDVQAEVQVRYQTCNATTCLPPKTITLSTVLSVTADGGRAINEALFAGYTSSLTEPPQAPPTSAPTGDASVGVSTLASFVGVLLLAFVGGMLLNVMPCVLPVIPIKILGLVHTQPDRARRLVLGAVMALGVLAFWLALGAALAGLSEQQAISQWFGHWQFNVGLGLFIVLMAVGMCGLFTMQLPRWMYAINPRHDSYSGAFGFGVMTGVLATPCIGPFMGAAASAVLVAGPAVTLSTFAAIGAGMAIPYFALTAWPALVSRIPRSGPANELIKQVLGLLMIAAGTFFIGTGINSLLSGGQRSIYQWYWWLAAGIAVGACVWMVYRAFGLTTSRNRRVAFATIGVVLVGSSLALAYEATRPSAIDWVFYTPERLVHERGNVVLLDFTADWCINCKVLERTVLETRPVISAAAASDVTAIKVDLTSDESPGWRLLADHGRVGIPLLVILGPDGEEVFKADVYTPDQIAAAIESAKR